jgi:serine/threonine protein phosphatase PrpC
MGKRSTNATAIASSALCRLLPHKVKLKYLGVKIAFDAVDETHPKNWFHDFIDKIRGISQEEVSPPQIPPTIVEAKPDPVPKPAFTPGNGLAAFEWSVTGKSVRGSTHIRAELPNQDAIGWQPASGAGPVVILALSDGHGSAKSFRSENGASFAIEAAIEEIRSLLAGQPDLTDLTAIKRTAEERLPREIVRHWAQMVKDHASQNPVTSEELEKAIQKSSTPVDREALEDNILLWYGTTIIIAVATASFIFFVQQGDGDILTVSDNDEVTRPMASDERLFANETLSLCDPEAWRDFRFAFQIVSDSPPALVLLSTDGYANSFTNQDEFLKVGPDLLRMVRNVGLGVVGEHLEGWLNESSGRGSGDDITLGLIYRSQKSGSSGKESTSIKAES